MDKSLVTLGGYWVDGSLFLNTVFTGAAWQP